MTLKKLAFIYDHRYLKKEKKIFSSGAFNYDVWKRFLKGFSEVTVFGSIYQTDNIDVSQLNRVDGPNVSFEHISYISTSSAYIKNLLFPNRQISKKISRFDAVVIRIPGELSFNAYWIAKNLGIPVGVEVVGCPFDAYWNYGSLRGKMLAPIAYFRMRRILKDATHSVYVTKRFLQNRYPTSGKNIHASNVDIEVPSKKILENKIIRIIKKAKNKNFKIGLMGSMNVGYKGHIEILRAIAKVKTELPQISLDIVGPGNASWVINEAKKLNILTRINIIGKLPSGDPIVEWLDSIDIYVHPSKQEGLPRSVIEAMSRACPVLASSIAGIPELLEEKYMHPPGDYKTLAKHLIKFLTDKRELVKMAKKNYEKSKEYDSSILQEKRLEYWNNFAEQI